MRKSAGFTLMELMIVIAIIGIIAAIAIPNYLAYLPSKRMKSAARDMYSTFQIAKMRAIRDNTPVIILLDTGADTYTVFNDNGDGGGTANNRVQDGAEPTIRTGQMPFDVDMTTNFGGNWLGFTPRGMPVGNNIGRVNLDNAAQGLHREVRLRITGNFVIEE